MKTQRNYGTAQKAQDYHVKRAAGGVGASMLTAGLASPVALPYAGYHVYKAATVKNNFSKPINTRNHKTGTRTSRPQPVKPGGRVRKKR